MWILHEISNRISFNKTNNTSKNSAAESLSKMVPATPNTMLVVHNVISNFLSEPVKAFLKNLNDFNFPIFEFNKAAMGRPLTILAHSLIVESGLSERLHLPLEKLMSFLEAVESSYDSSLACKLIFFLT